LQYALDRTDHTVHVIVEIAARINLGGVPEGEVRDGVGKLLACRHARAIDQNGEDRHAAFQGGLHLDANGIGLFIDPATLSLAGADPFNADNDDNDVAVLKCLLNVVTEVGPKRDVVDVHEDGCVAEVSGETVPDPARDRVGVRSAIGNDDLRHEGLCAPSLGGLADRPKQLTSRKIAARARRGNSALRVCTNRGAACRCGFIGAQRWQRKVTKEY